MRLTLIRKDAKSIYVRAGGYVARPGPVRGYDHAYDMSDGGLVEGNRIKARHWPQTPLTIITLSDGRVLHWHHDERKENSNGDS